MDARDGGRVEAPLGGPRRHGGEALTPAPPGGGRGPPRGEKPPAFPLPGGDAKPYGLASFKDKPVLVVAFWCNHCPYVQAWEDRTIATQKEYAAKGVQFVPINPNETEGYPEDDFPHMVERAES